MNPPNPSVIPRRSLRPLIIALLPGQQRSLNRLKAMREQLSLDVNNLINDFGPKLYEDFDQVCNGRIHPLQTANLQIIVPNSRSIFFGSSFFWHSRHLAQEERHWRG